MNKQNNNNLSLQDKFNFARKIYNNEILRKTMEYQKKYGFELNPIQGHELWNVEVMRLSMRLWEQIWH